MTRAEKRAAAGVMDVYKDGRDRLLQDSKRKAVALYLGLHSLKESERETYLDSYLIGWLLSHFEAFQHILDRTDEKGVYRSAFGKNYLEFLSYGGHRFFDTELAVGVLEEYRKVLEHMLDTSLSWEEGYNRLLVEKKKQEEKFARLKEEMEKGTEAHAG